MGPGTGRPHPLGREGAFLKLTSAKAARRHGLWSRPGTGQWRMALGSGPPAPGRASGPTLSACRAQGCPARPPWEAPLAGGAGPG
jgi:hypothetical protein